MLLQVIYRKEDSQSEATSFSREDISPENEYLQVASVMSNDGASFQRHRHLEQHRDVMMTQECWIVISGRIEVKCFDIGDALLATEELGEGDMMVTFYGGHAYRTLEDNTILYEIKQGPYNGFDKDKVRF